MLGSLFNKVAGLQTCNCFKKRDSNSGVSYGYCEIVNNSFFVENLCWLLLTVLPQYSKVNWSICSFISCLQVLFNLIKILHRKRANLYYHMTKQFLPCFNWFIICFRFQNMFCKNISCFRFWWRTYTNCCTNNNVISHVRKFSLLALCSWSISGYDLENGRMQKYWIKSMVIKILILISLHSCLLC